MRFHAPGRPGSTGTRRFITPTNSTIPTGAIGYFYQQTTNDTVSGKAVVGSNADGSTSLGNRGRVFNLGVQATLPIGKLGGMAFKWERDMLVQNKPRGNTLWFQFVVPLHH